MRILGSNTNTAPWICRYVDITRLGGIKQLLEHYSPSSKANRAGFVRRLRLRPLLAAEY